MLRKILILVLIVLPTSVLAQSAPQPIGPNGQPMPIGSGVTWTASMWKNAFQQYVSTNNGRASGLEINQGELTASTLDATSKLGGDGFYMPASVPSASLLRAIRVTPQMFLQGVSEDAVTDWTPIFQSAINFVEAHGGGYIFVPARSAPYPFTGSLLVNTNGTVLTGDGKRSDLMLNAQPSDFITFTGCTECGVQDVAISGNLSYDSVLKGGKEPYAVTLGVGTNSAFVKRVWMQFLWNGVHITQSNGEDQVTDHVDMSEMIGHYGARFDGTAAHNSYRATIENFVGGNVPAISYQVNSSSGYRWKAGVAYSLGDTVQSTDGGVWVAKAAGTSGTTEPSGVPGSGALTFSTPVTDGGVSWLYASGNLQWIVQDSYAYSLVVRSAALLGGVHAFSMLDTANTGYSAPKWFFGYDVEGDHNLLQALNVQAGESAKCDLCWLGSLVSYGAEYSSSTTEGAITNSRLAYNGAGGIRVDGGTNFTFLGNHIGQNCGYASVQGDTTCAGLWIADGTQRLVANGNVIGTLGNPLNSANPQAYGIYYQTGSSTTGTALTGNVLYGNKTAAIFNTNKGPGNVATGNSSDN